MASSEIDQMRNNFNSIFEKLVSVKNINSFYINNKQYDEFLNAVAKAKQSTSLTKLQRRRLKRYDICSIGGIQKLVVPLKEGESSIIRYLKNEEMFDVLYETHIAVKHGGKHRMLAEVKKKYKNVTQEVVLLFLKFCPTCQMKQKSKKEIAAKSVKSLPMNSRCQVDLIDMQVTPDGPFKFIMVYQDLLTKFIQLRPLICDTSSEIAKQLLDIFCIFGAPEILQSNSEHKFIYHTMEKLRSMWKGLNIVQGDPEHSQSQESIQKDFNQDIEYRLANWMITENNNHWSEGLKFVQFMMNQSYHDDIKASPHKAIFRTGAKTGISTNSILSKEVCDSIRTEEDLATILDSIIELPKDSKILPRDFLDETEDEEILSDIDISENFKFITSLKDGKRNSDTVFDENIKLATEETDSVDCILNKKTNRFKNKRKKRKRI